MKYNISASEQTLTIEFYKEELCTKNTPIASEVMAIFKSSEIKSVPLKRLVVDLTQISSINSIGLNLLTSLYRESQKNGASINAIVDDPQIKRIFDYTRLSSYITLTMVGAESATV